MSSKAGIVLIGGGSGFIGSQLQKALKRRGYDVVIVSRRPGPQNMSWGELSRNGLPPGTTAVVSMAGQNVLDPKCRWSPGFKQNVWASRVNTTKSLANAILAAEKKPSVFVSMSGVGYYPPSTTEVYTEESDGGYGDFFAELCRDWEAAAQLPAEAGVRNVTVRSGVVLGREGGMIKQLYPVFYAGGGGPIGSGNQFFPWIHVHDVANLFAHAIEKENVVGTVNGVAPAVITNSEFAKAFGKALWRPAFVPLPELVVKTVFGNERSRMMLEGQKVIPKRTQEYGFLYQYPSIESACKEFAPLFYKASD